MKSKWWGRGAVALVLAAGGTAVVSRAKEPTTKVDTGAIELRVVARAVVAPVDGITEVKTEIDARTLRVHVREGDKVEAGQVLADLHDEVLELAVVRARAEVGAHEAALAGLRRGGRPEAQREVGAQLRAAERQLTLSEDDARRRAQLHEHGAVSEAVTQEGTTAALVAKEQLEALRARAAMLRSSAPDDVRAAEYRLDAARASLHTAEARLARTHVLSPIAGVVLARRIDPGDVVRVIDQASLFEIADPTKIELRAEVEELQATLVQLGSRVTVTPPGGGTALAHGEVVRLGARVGRRTVAGDPSELRADSLVRAVFVRIEQGIDLALPIGQRVEVQINLEPRSGVARVPRAAVSLRDGRAVVEVALPLQRREVPVVLGAADDRYVEVRGVNPGTTVVLHSP
ncbi:MAG TPA: efflux RND transporter periplasmic adaptor subunit [Labilithrix sp.]|nr:efflux RND transporter periplasmic adaptor subunit [Labilithrix sp.]